MEEKKVIAMLGALSQETRLKTVRYLVSRAPNGASAGDIGNHVNATSSRISFHLSALEKAGIVESERQSRHIFYRANLANLGNMVSFLLNDCCANHPDILACCKPNEACC